ncbi:alanyl-tRNA editing protein [Pallidibacillus pasinlerensis]|uniref:Alanyl-transfer RNA synthetases family profile domain-containing protein n=1 Tax=Pallidibacillus pasinlerensis TaxID=2703818 RepID=A0ABX0A6Q8_9BACI|nr:DHHA1 domain-containing protein [Pallidibacillus pasinlerensis]NCU16838.1 hypothetical protein [Pallidibacillus pasinlerensis]
MTEKLFYTDPKVFEWTTEITGVFEHDDLYYVTLKETAFYPEGGGQPADLGWIGNYEVIDCIKKDEEVFHVLNTKPEEKVVDCKIDHYRRIDHTQHHSGQHLLSAICLDLFGINTLSFHLSNETATIDLDVSSLSDEQLNKIEKVVNDHIVANHKVNVFYINRDEAEKYDIRKIPEGIDRLRIVQIENIEYNACAGTHVNSTSEIGLLKLLKTEKMKGKIRLYFICGLRLLKDYTEKHQLIADLSKLLTTGQDLLLNQVEKLKEANKEKERNYTTLFNQYADLLANQIIKEQGKEKVYQIFQELTIKELGIVSQKLLENEAQLIVLGTKNENKLLITQSGNLSIDCGKIVKEEANKYNGKGGGNAKRAQCSFTNEQSLEQFVLHIKEKINI